MFVRLDARSYARKDKGMRATAFPNEVEKLALNLLNIVRDTAQLKASEYDPVMLVRAIENIAHLQYFIQIDIFARIAEGYRNSPDLRLTWLQAMAKRHVESGNFAEAAEVCHSAHTARPMPASATCTRPR